MKPTPVSATLNAVPIVLRPIAAIGGGYAVSAGLTALLAVALPWPSPLHLPSHGFARDDGG